MPRPPAPEANHQHCARCFLPHRLCLCAEIPRLPCRCRVWVVRHWYESWRTTNTGRLVHLALEGSDLIDHGHKDYRLTPEDLPLPPRSCLLFPRLDDDAPAWAGGVPELLVVPDGSWSQARRMVRRVPGLAALPRLELPEGAAPSPARRIRKSPRPAARSTLEAVAAALALWEPPATSEALLALYDLLAERIDQARYGYRSSGNM
jgi:DTW domain-containing protein YfiP